jgi:hypothetical protein
MKSELAGSPMSEPVKATEGKPLSLLHDISYYSNAQSVGATASASATAVAKPQSIPIKTQVKPKPAVVVALQAVKSKLDEYVMGTWSYQVPPVMQIGRTERVSIKLSSTILKANSSASSNIKIESIRVYPFMAVKVLGEPQFTVTPLSTEQQVVSSDVTAWEFDVVPKQGGTQKLTIRITARIKMDNGTEETHDLPVVSKDVKVQVSWIYLVKTWFISNWQWLAGLLFSSGVLSWLFQRKKDKEQPDE